jgi:predicted ArsR family transcriptional regulator
MDDKKNFMICKTDEDIKMAFDPYRKNIIKTFMHSKEPMTVKEVADALGEVPAKVHYHVKKLEDYGILQLAKTKNINGIIAKYYKSVYEGILFEGSELSSSVYISQIPFIEDVFKRITEKFHSDLEKHYELVKNSEDKAQRKISAMVHHLYMTKEEQEEVLKQIDEIIEKYSEKDESKEEYSMLHTLARIK